MRIRAARSDRRAHLLQRDRPRAVLLRPRPNPKGFDDINKIERLCDQYQIPFATNAATAEVLVQGLRRGDLDWRNIVNPQKR